MDRRLFVFSGLAAAGCASVPPTIAPASAPLPELEAVAVTASRNGLRVVVASSGCTAKSDWAAFVERRNGAAALAFARRRLDRCRGLAGGTTTLLFSWRELGVSPGGRVILLNPAAP